MKYYIAFDGGGSKLQSILFDENFKLINSAKSGSMNNSSTSREKTEEFAEDCCRKLLANTGVKEIECVYGVFSSTVRDVLSEIIKVNKFDDRGGEGAIGIYAAFVRTNAVVALSGTGSVVFFVAEDGHGAESGGYGSIVYDEGSGYYLGRRAFAAAICDAEGRGPHTMITELICKKLKAKDLFEATYKVYNNDEGKAPIPTVASVATCVGEAARAGDNIAMELLKEAGENLADQTVGFVKRFNIPSSVPVIISGGHFKNDVRFFNAFKNYISERDPERKIVIPYFEPIVGAVLAHRYHDGPVLNDEEIEFVKKEYSDFRYKIVGMDD